MSTVIDQVGMYGAEVGSLQCEYGANSDGLREIYYAIPRPGRNGGKWVYGLFVP